MITTSKRFFWLVSYPKSGNTWMRVLLSNYFSEQDAPIHINQLNYGWDLLSYEHIERQLALTASHLTWYEVLDYLPAVFEYTARQEPYPHFVKIHSAYLYTSQGQAVFAPAVPCGAVYLVRNPLDVAVSFSFHDGSSMERVVQDMNTSHTFLDYEAHRISRKFPEKLSSWSEHVLSWVTQQDIPLCVVRYEDLLKDPFSEFKRVIEFLDDSHQVDEARLEKSIEYSQFDQLKSQEANFGFREKLASPTQFFRSGKANTWRDYQSDLLPDAIIRQHRAVMTRFGYLDAHGHPS